MAMDRRTLGIIALCIAVWGFIVLRNATEVVSADVHERTVGPEQVHAFARAQLAAIQPRSFADRVELCGMIAQDADGNLSSREVIVGHEATCDISYFTFRNRLPVATYHTHGGFDPRYDSEVPSLIDVQGDMASGMDGYVATPGGRLWHIDPQTGTSRQLCGAGCLPVDPRHTPCPADPVQQSYSVVQLHTRFTTPAPACRGNGP